ncbi:type II toxin-antitoxin system HicB family antitoxin [Bosea sp. (in: a-proteobacteria)]|uniref:type II toxin-antitoxin system HicB family antitoxin n=1 Tax=Bosea sp. (in: a-proteobacteria) TaxID=1871050 RepID=UPI003562C08F
MSGSYFALIHQPEDGSGWGVTFPDLPGCVSAGSTYEEAHQNARQALAGHVAALLADGEDVPSGRSYVELHKDPDYLAEIRAPQAPTPTLIPLDEIAAPKERVNVMLDRGVLRKIDEAARAKGVSRSAFIEQAAGKAALKRSA